MKSFARRARLWVAVAGLASFSGCRSLPVREDAKAFGYSITNGTVTITKYTGNGGAVTIPARINSLPVTEIGRETFADRTNLTSVVIPDGVAVIGEFAFAGSSLATVVIGNCLVSIREGAFGCCS